jgi:HPt (histidine-containing phosphotransfer) domain-containing protein
LACHNWIVQLNAMSTVLNREQLREVTMDDPDLMREILSALIDDTAKQILLLDAAIRDGDPVKCARLAHYSKGACANVGAESAADLLRHIEQRASGGDFQECRVSLAALTDEIGRLRSEAAAL